MRSRIQKTPSAPTEREILKDIFAPDGGLIGDAVGGATDEVRTVSPDDLQHILDKLDETGASVVDKPGYDGIWHEYPDGSGYGVRVSPDSGTTIDIDAKPDLPKGLKVHEGE